jgi:hypothetical protein
MVDRTKCTGCGKTLDPGEAGGAWRLGGGWTCAACYEAERNAVRLDLPEYDRLVHAIGRTVNGAGALGDQLAELDPAEVSMAEVVATVRDLSRLVSALACHVSALACDAGAVPRPSAAGVAGGEVTHVSNREGTFTAAEWAARAARPPWDPDVD